MSLLLGTNERMITSARHRHTCMYVHTCIYFSAAPVKTYVMFQLIKKESIEKHLFRGFGVLVSVKGAGPSSTVSSVFGFLGFDFRRESINV